MSYSGLDDIKDPTIKSSTGDCVDFVSLVLAKREMLQYGNTNNGELAAFIAYAQAFPRNALFLIDTYDTLHSGVLNFILVGLVLLDLGYVPKGIRLDSGDLAYLSVEVRNLFRKADETHSLDVFNHCLIVASNDINEDVLLSLNHQGHSIDCFGIGTHLVTCQKQPALGCVYKLVEVSNIPRIKLSQEVQKLVIPCRKNCYRLYNKEQLPIIDLMTECNEPPPEAGQRILCRHPFLENLRAYVTPSKVENLHALVWDGGKPTEYVLPTLEESKQRCVEQLSNMRTDHIRAHNATPYKVSISIHLFDYMHKLWLDEAPVADLS